MRTCLKQRLQNSGNIPKKPNKHYFKVLNWNSNYKKIRILGLARIVVLTIPESRKY